MKVIVVILAILVVTMVITPAYAVIVEFQSEKTSYKKGDKIVFSGRTDAAHSNKMVAVKVYGPNGDFVMIRETFSDANGNFQTIPIDTSVDKTAIKFSTKGIYNATAFYSQEPTYLGTSILFDYSPDGSPVSPSAAEVMAQKNKPAQQTQPTQPTQPTPPTQPTQPSQPPQPTQPAQPTQPTQPTQPETPKCGPGTTLKDGICVIAEYEPEPEPETESRYKETHIPGFPDPNREPQYYIDRYNNEPEYKAWFDRNFPDDTIYEILGVPGPRKTHIPGFPDPNKDPQSYINRYNTEPEYKAWFDRNFPDDTIYEIVGVEEPAPASSCGPGTHLEGSVCVLDESKGLFGGGCLVATAAFGSELSPQVQQLRELRDGVISKTSSGVMFLTAFNSIYYSFSPTVADWERQNPAFKELVKITLTPLLSILSILDYADIDSESQMIGYGLAILLLNAAIYFVAPAFAIIKIRNTLANRSRFK
ncbi:MAG TPA: CFI-box-CTERM domain-containing protein [Candidatus Nitrosotenuis sp.]|nr:CFI-box-CTERM domain-containing protein [Candidatus Nitrosotenuis sp.]